MRSERKMDFTIYQEACSADSAWTEEIRKAFPNAHPGDVRFTTEGKGAPGTTLHAAFIRARTSSEAWMAHIRESRKGL